MGNTAPPSGNGPSAQQGLEGGRGERHCVVAAKRHMALLTTLACSVPYLYLLGYLRLSLHDERHVAAVPGNSVFMLLGAVGVVLPFAGVFAMVRRLIHERERFRLKVLVEVYGCVVLVFASGYGLLQASSPEPAIAGMGHVWSDSPRTLGQHIEALHSIYLDSLYLSTITITTVGYGDMVPVIGSAKLLTAVEGLVGIGFVGLALGHYFSCASSRGLPD